MLKKLSLLPAFTGSCRLIILDELIDFLDSNTREILLTTIEKFRKEHGTSFLISNHISDAMTGISFMRRNITLKTTRCKE